MSLNAPAEIRMINSIAGHFGYLHAEQAAAAVADHIKRFWDPRMKQRLLLLAASDTGISIRFRSPPRRCCAEIYSRAASYRWQRFGSSGLPLLVVAAATAPFDHLGIGIIPRESAVSSHPSTCVRS